MWLRSSLGLTVVLLLVGSVTPGCAEDSKVGSQVSKDQVESLIAENVEPGATEAQIRDFLKEHGTASPPQRAAASQYTELEELGIDDDAVVLAAVFGNSGDGELEGQVTALFVLDRENRLDQWLVIEDFEPSIRG